jgi:hypothetical protein
VKVRLKEIHANGLPLGVRRAHLLGGAAAWEAHRFQCAPLRDLVAPPQAKAGPNPLLTGDPNRVRPSTQAAAVPSSTFMPPELSEINEPAARRMAERMVRAPIPVPSLPVPALPTAFVPPSGDHSDGDAPPVVLLHGFDSSSLEMRRLHPLLEREVEAWALDLVGWGFTDHSVFSEVGPKRLRGLGAGASGCTASRPAAAAGARGRRPCRAEPAAARGRLRGPVTSSSPANSSAAASHAAPPEQGARAHARGQARPPLCLLEGEGGAPHGARRREPRRRNRPGVCPRAPRGARGRGAARRGAARPIWRGETRRAGAHRLRRRPARRG